jgi:hypothetical protein
VTLRGVVVPVIVRPVVVYKVYDETVPAAGAVNCTDIAVRFGVAIKPVTGNGVVTEIVEDAV